MNQLLLNVLVVGAGSCAGGVARYLVGRVVQPMVHCSFPIGTFIVNLLGCFLIGLFYGFIDRGWHVSDGVRLFITVGFCGGFTTFSTFMNENYLLFSGNEHIMVTLYALSSVALGFLMVYLAYYLTRIL